MALQAHIAIGSPDGELIAASLRRPEAFAEIFERHFVAIHRYLARRIGRAAADDLASQTFTIAFERRGTFRAAETGAAGARPWLLGIATNLLCNQRRAEQRFIEIVARLAADAAPAALTPELEAESELAAALADLPADQRDVLVLYAWEELTYEEIACVLDVPVGTVRSRLSRARSQLRSSLTVHAPQHRTGAEDHEESR